jgi:membrane-bound lytic murein transglycosylase D
MHAAYVMRRFLIPYLAGAALAAGADAPAPTPTPVDNTDEVLRVGQELFDQFAPPEVKEQYSFPTREEWDKFAARLQRAMDGDSLQDLSSLEPEARSALEAVRTLPGYEDYSDWLALRIDDMEAARLAAQAAAPAPSPSAAGGPSSRIPSYDLWLRRETGRRVPANAAELMPQLRRAFEAEGVPPQLAWVAEVESSLNPAARSPAGAKGLFQLMPETAHLLGLSIFFPDERSDPGKSAHAAARYLHMLFAKFGSWPLALAAYNAGEGRVSRLLASRGTADYAGVASALPAETRMYVPKVCALVAVRTGTTL